MLRVQKKGKASRKPMPDPDLLLLEEAIAEKLATAAAAGPCIKALASGTMENRRKHSSARSRSLAGVRVEKHQNPEMAKLLHDIDRLEEQHEQVTKEQQAERQVLEGMQAEVAVCDAAIREAQEAQRLLTMRMTAVKCKQLSLQAALPQKVSLLEAARQKKLGLEASLVPKVSLLEAARQEKLGLEASLVPKVRRPRELEALILQKRAMPPSSAQEADWLSKLEAARHEKWDVESLLLQKLDRLNELDAHITVLGKSCEGQAAQGKTPEGPRTLHNIPNPSMHHQLIKAAMGEAVRSDTPEHPRALSDIPDLSIAQLTKAGNTCCETARSPCSQPDIPDLSLKRLINAVDREKARGPPGSSCTPADASSSCSGHLRHPEATCQCSSQDLSDCLVERPAHPCLLPSTYSLPDAHHPSDDDPGSRYGIPNLTSSHAEGAPGGHQGEDPGLITATGAHAWNSRATQEASTLSVRLMGCPDEAREASVRRRAEASHSSEAAEVADRGGKEARAAETLDAQGPTEQRAQNAALGDSPGNFSQPAGISCEEVWLLGIEHQRGLKHAAAMIRHGSHEAKGVLLPLFFKAKNQPDAWAQAESQLPDVLDCLEQLDAIPHWALCSTLEEATLIVENLYGHELSPATKQHMRAGLADMDVRPALSRFVDGFARFVAQKKLSAHLAMLCLIQLGERADYAWQLHLELQQLIA